MLAHPIGISIFSRLSLCIVAAALAPVATYGNVAETTQKLRIASLNLCTDTLLLQYADPQQIASITWLSADANLSPFATYAKRFHRNNGRAEDIFNDFLALNYEPFIYTLDGRFEKKTMLQTGNNYLFIPEEKIRSEVRY